MADLAVVLVAVLLGAYVKGVTGTGLPLVAIPVLAAFGGVEHAIVTLALPGVVTNTWLMRANWTALSATRNLWRLGVAGCGGVVVGTYLLRSVDEQLMALLLAGLVAAYIVIALSAPQVRIGDAAGRWSAAPVGLASGVLQGTTGIASPLLLPYLHAYRLERAAYVLAITLLFQVFSVVQVVSLAVAGAFDTQRLLLSIAALAPIMVGLRVGMRHGERLSAQAFDRWVLALLALTALTLAYDAV